MRWSARSAGGGRKPVATVVYAGGVTFRCVMIPSLRRSRVSPSNFLSEFLSLASSLYAWMDEETLHAVAMEAARDWDSIYKDGNTTREEVLDMARERMAIDEP